MKDEITVHVVDYGRKHWYMRYTDPATGKQTTRSTGIDRNAKGAKKLAEREAAKWEADLREGRYKAPNKITWEEFRERYESEALPGLADTTGAKVIGVFNAIDETLGIRRLSDLTAARISEYQQALRALGRAEDTIKGHMAHLKSALNWAKDMGLLTEVPKIKMPKRVKKSKVMKGRPITTEEFERMLSAVPKVVGDERAGSWRHLLRGLWWTGLRLGESLALTWDGDGIRIDLTGRHPMLRIPRADEKGNRDRILPLAPEAAEFLLATPDDERTGYVFNPANTAGRGRPIQRTVGGTIAAFGETAKIKVDVGRLKGKAHTKYASAQDLRRAFGLRWSQRVMPAVLQQLMRHETIETTLSFYVGRDAETTADLLYDIVGGGNTSGNTPQDSPNHASDDSTQVLDT